MQNHPVRLSHGHTGLAREQLAREQFTDGGILNSYRVKLQFTEMMNEDSFGQMILDALGPDEEEEEDDDGEPFRPFLGCEDADKWGNAIDILADEILWDRDFEMEQDMLQLTVQERTLRMSV